MQAADPGVAWNALNSDMVYESNSMHVLVEAGELPPLTATTKISLKLKIIIRMLK